MPDAHAIRPNTPHAMPSMTRAQFDALRRTGQPLPDLVLIRDRGVCKDVYRTQAIPDHPHLSDRIVRRSIRRLADLTELHRLGAEDDSRCLSDLLDSGEAFDKQQQVRLLRIISWRLQQLENWTEQQRPENESDKDFVDTVRDCAVFLRQRGF